MHHNYKNLFLTATLAVTFTGQSFGQDQTVPAAKPPVSPRPNSAMGRAVNPPTAPAVSQASRAAPALKPCDSVTVDPPTYVSLGKFRVIRLPFPAARMLVGGQSSSPAGRPVAATDPNAAGTPANTPPAIAAPAQAITNGVADMEITLLSPTELFFLGKRAGSMNVVLQSANGRCVVKDIYVTIDPDTLQSKLAELMPEETGIKVKGAENQGCPI